MVTRRNDGLQLAGMSHGALSALHRLNSLAPAGRRRASPVRQCDDGIPFRNEALQRTDRLVQPALLSRGDLRGFEKLRETPFETGKDIARRPLATPRDAVRDRIPAAMRRAGDLARLRVW